VVRAYLDYSTSCIKYVVMEVPPNLTEILCLTLARVEEHSDLPPNDPALVQLRHLVLSLIAELELAKTNKAA